MNDIIAQIRALEKEPGLISHIGAILGWDQETYMPEDAIDERSEQLAYLEGLAHEKITSKELGSLLEKAGCTKDNPSGNTTFSADDKAYLRAVYRNYSKETKLPTDFVTERAKAISKSQAAWSEAKTNNNFKAFEPHLEKMVEFAKKEAEFYGFKDNPYDGLLDLYEPGLTVKELDKVFGALQKDLVSLLDKIKSKPQQNDSFLHENCPEAKQDSFNKYIMKELGYNTSKGRLDKTAHPFSTTLGVNDSRITTRYIEDFFPSSLFSTMHETGHALYELGINKDWALSSLGEACSMAIHESQSRTWENIVGRSSFFWKKYYPELKKHLSPNLDTVSLEDFLKAINKVETSFIRTESDEVTYGLHVILRYNIEKRLMDGSLQVKDLPAAWNAEFASLFGITPPDDTHGCLQDIHWSMGAIGYFPSYALGNVYGSQFWNQMKKDIPDIENKIESGDTKALLEWLRKNIHQYGSYYTPKELVKKVTGEELTSRYFVEYLNSKYSSIYNL